MQNASSDQNRLNTDALLETFSNPTLTASSYLNTVLPSYGQSSSLQKVHSEAVNELSSLDQATQDLIARLERVVTEMMSSATRLKYEVELLAGDVEQLDKSVLQDLKPLVDSEIATKSSAMQRLEMLELVRRRLVEVISTFDEAKQLDCDMKSDDGGNSEQKIRALLSQNKYKLAKDEVDRLEKLTEIWNGTQEFTAKQEFISKLQRLVQETISRSEKKVNLSQNSGTISGSATPNTKSPALPSFATFERQEYPNVRASAEYLKQEAREGYMGFLESWKKMRQT
ncbi:uncharacterized protein V1516DRAFT_498930 [Lipomyces oligophaga]|uniref:uncharacterized protein n=1 Tax=Lipomyces oligophaga TaxID=45792 RepID=UPI0034CE5AEA